MKTVENKEIIIKVKSDKALRDRQTAMQRRQPQGCKMKVINNNNNYNNNKFYNLKNNKE